MKNSVKYGFSAVVLLAAGFMSGCANTVYEGRFSWEDGWRQGVVTAVGDGPLFAEKQAKSCKNAKLATQQSARYVTIMYRPVTGRVWITVPAPANASLKSDDLVYVNVLDCSKGVELRSS